MATRYSTICNDNIIYQNIPRNKRLCANCLLNEIENENDVLFTCPLYYTVRMKYITVY